QTNRSARKIGESVMETETILPANVFDDQDFYVPAFLIKVNDRELPGGVVNDVMSVTYTDSLTQIDSFDMTINNWDPDGRKFKYTDRDIFNQWKDVEVWIGYYKNGRDERRRMLFGEITTMTPNFPQSGGPTLAIRGLNLLHRFRTKQETRPFFGKRDTEVAQ